jgi:regulator of sigma E protease
MKQIQTRHARIIVQRMGEISKVSWRDEDQFFLSQINPAKMSEITAALGTKNEVQQAGNFFLLPPVEPRPIAEFPMNDSQKSQYEQRESEQRKQIESIQNPKDKAEAMRLFENEQKRLRLGISPNELQDLPVKYNPSPFTLFSDVFKDTWRTVFALFSGTLNPKWMSGPVGIVQVIHQSWMIGVKEAVFWMGLISLNLAILNLLPIPVLDGGHILFSLIEQVTKKPIKAKTMEKLIIPFIILLVALFVYLTYHDLVRLFGRFFK